MKNLFLKLLIIFFTSSCVFAHVEQQEAFKNDYLYSEEYFDYLIECAENEKRELEEKKALEQQRILEEQKKLAKNSKKNQEIDLKDEMAKDEDNSSEDFSGDDYIAADLEPFKLRIIETTNVAKYSETYKVTNSKTTIPVTSNINFIQNLTSSRNKYSSNDYKILAGAEYNPFKCFRISTGLETNYRGMEQLPISRKVYFSPSVHINDIFSLTFHNKMNINSYSTDHDIGLNISPLKSKALDFGVYAGLTRKQDGQLSESINFSTSFYFF